MPADTVHAEVRTLTIRDLPLLVVSLAVSLETADAAGPEEPQGDAGGDDQAARLARALAAAGVARVDRFVGNALPRGARVGFVVDDVQLRLVDERDATLLRAPRDGLDQAWVRSADRLRGTMLVVGHHLGLEALVSAEQLSATLDAEARGGRLRGAIVGVARERPTLPLAFG